MNVYFICLDFFWNVFLFLWRYSYARDVKEKKAPLFEHQIKVQFRNFAFNWCEKALSILLWRCREATSRRLSGRDCFLYCRIDSYSPYSISMHAYILGKKRNRQTDGRTDGQTDRQTRLGWKDTHAEKKGSQKEKERKNHLKERKNHLLGKQAYGES